MAKSTVYLKKSMPFVLVVTLYGLLTFLIDYNTGYFSDTLSMAITIDVLLIIPLIYFLTIRKTIIPKITIIPVVFLGFVIGTLLLPEEYQFYIDLVKTWLLPVLELGVIGFLLFKIIQLHKAFKKEKCITSDFFDTLKKVSTTYLPKKIDALFAMEIAVVYYGFLHWKRLKLAENEFSYHKNSGSPTLMIALCFIIAIETYVLHIVLLKWSSTVAWMVSGISIYSILQFFAYAKSLSKRPIRITDRSLVLSYGIMGDCGIPLSNIEQIELSSNAHSKKEGFQRFSFLGNLEPYNMVIKVKEGHTFRGLYGLKKEFTFLGLYVDEAQRLKEAIEKHQHSRSS